MIAILHMTSTSHERVDFKSHVLSTSFGFCKHKHAMPKNIIYHISLAHPTHKIYQEKLVIHFGFVPFLSIER